MVHNLNPECRIEAYIITGLMTALAFIRHKDNIKRLAKGTIGIVGPKRMDYENVVDNLKNLKSQLDGIFDKEKGQS